MAAFSPVIESFSISHAMILDGSTTFLTALALVGDEWDVYGVNEASLEPDMDEYDNEGDDAVQSTWAWLNKGELSVQAGYVSFPLIGSLTGQSVTSSTAGGKTIFGMDLWHEDALNVPPKPALLKMPARDKHGNAADLLIGLYKVQFKPITFDGPAYKDGLKINYDGNALYSRFDELGVAFADGKQRVGRLLAIQR